MYVCMLSTTYVNSGAQTQCCSFITSVSISNTVLCPNAMYVQESRAPLTVQQCYHWHRSLDGGQGVLQENEVLVVLVEQVLELLVGLGLQVEHTHTHTCAPNHANILHKQLPLLNNEQERERLICVK